MDTDIRADEPTDTRITLIDQDNEGDMVIGEDRGGVCFDIKGDVGKAIISLSNAEANRLADWIKANTY